MTHIRADIWGIVESPHTMLPLGLFPFWILEAFRFLLTSLPPEDGVRAGGQHANLADGGNKTIIVATYFEIQTMQNDAKTIKGSLPSLG